MYHHDTEFPWLTDGKTTPSPEYLEAGWSRTGESDGPGTYTYEFKVTPWEFLDYQGPEGSTIVDLEVGNIIHIGYLFKDYDTDDSYRRFLRFSAGSRCLEKRQPRGRLRVGTGRDEPVPHGRGDRFLGPDQV